MNASRSRIIPAMTAVAAIAGVAACNNDVNSPRLSGSETLIESAFGSSPAGFNE